MRLPPVWSGPCQASPIRGSSVPVLDSEKVLPGGPEGFCLFGPHPMASGAFCSLMGEIEPSFVQQTSVECLLFARCSVGWGYVRSKGGR